MSAENRPKCEKIFIFTQLFMCLPEFLAYVYILIKIEIPNEKKKSDPPLSASCCVFDLSSLFVLSRYFNRNVMHDFHASKNKNEAEKKKIETFHSFNFTIEKRNFTDT